MDVLLIIVIAIIFLLIKAYALFCAANFASADNGSYQSCLIITFICGISVDAVGTILGGYGLLLGLIAILFQVRYLRVPADMFLVFVITLGVINMVFIWAFSSIVA